MDLSLFLGKKVKLTFRNCPPRVDTIIETDHCHFKKMYPYQLKDKRWTYKRNGVYTYNDMDNFDEDIMSIEIVDNPKYHQLEEQIEALQKEIQRLKDEEDRIMAEYGEYKVVKHSCDTGMVLIYKKDTLITNHTIPIDVMTHLAKQMSS
jgi:hypothetical protein